MEDLSDEREFGNGLLMRLFGLSLSSATRLHLPVPLRKDLFRVIVLTYHIFTLKKRLI